MTKLTKDASEKIKETILKRENTVAEIARTFNVPDSAVRYHARVLGVKLPKSKIGPKKKIDDDGAKFIELYNKGYSYDELASILEVSRAYINAQVTKLSREGRLNHRITSKRDRNRYDDNSVANTILLWCRGYSYKEIYLKTKLPKSRVEKIVTDYSDFKEKLLQSKKLSRTIDSAKINKITEMYLGKSTIKDIKRECNLESISLDKYLDQLDNFLCCKKVPEKALKEVSESVEPTCVEHENPVEDTEIDKERHDITILKLSDGSVLEIKNCPSTLISLIGKIADGSLNVSDIVTIGTILNETDTVLYTMTKED